MLKFIFLVSGFITSLISLNTIPSYAGGCSNHLEESAQIECKEGVKDCIPNGSDNLGLENTIES